MSDEIEKLRSCAKRANDAAAEREQKKARFLEFLNENLVELSKDLKALFLMQQMQEREITDEQAQAFMEDEMRVAIAVQSESSSSLCSNLNGHVKHIQPYRTVSEFSTIPEYLEFVAMAHYYQPTETCGARKEEIEAEVKKNHTIVRLEGVMGDADKYQERGIRLYTDIMEDTWWEAGKVQCILGMHRLIDMPQHFRENVPQELLSATPTLKKVLNRIEQDLDLLKGHANDVAAGQKK